MSNSSGAIGGLMLFVIGAVIYFLPTIIAKSRKHPNRSSIFLLNLCLGWTLIGWVVSLVWSASSIAGTEQPLGKQAEMPMLNKYREIERLSSLKERGLISDDEYQAEKMKLLRS
ncbi:MULTISPECIES: superinfection immunity protein [unclassified Pseudomonas]|uniref:superinfection immunity protein n=1 Tax=unclassified Pseudomonas TaxID=196821 RepID=UPI0025EEB5FD|nr:MULTISPECIES: superinfection immunity protein [unclassified Pseudomonas]